MGDSVEERVYEKKPSPSSPWPSPPPLGFDDESGDLRLSFRERGNSAESGCGASVDSEEGEHFFGIPSYVPSPHHRNPPSREDSMGAGGISERETFEVSDDSDFEILDDDEEEEDALIHEQRRLQQQQEKQQIPPGMEEGDPKSFEEHADQASYSPSPPSSSPPRAESPPRSPVATSAGSAALMPHLTPTRRLLNKFSFTPNASPKQRVSFEKDHGEVVPPDLSHGKEDKPRRRLLQKELKSPIPTLKAIRARAMAAYGKEPKIATNEGAEWEKEAPVPDDESSSDGSSYSEDSSMGEDANLFEDDRDRVVDFSSLSALPNSFLSVTPHVYDFLDPNFVKNIAQEDISTFAWEHHLFVKGLLQLLAERDHIGVEDDVDNTSNIIKMGPLKKRYAQIWFVKYVEIRKGNLTYYADNDKGLEDERTTIHLRKRTCVCQAITGKDGTSSSGFLFELKAEGKPKLFWMAKSEEEREAWVRAINQAMIGETEDSQNNPLDMSLYQNAVEAYQSVQASLQEVNTRQDYMVAVDSLLYRQRSSSALRLPVKWFREQIMEEDDAKKLPDAPHIRVRSTITDFWKTLCNTSVVINGFLIEANSPYSAERVIGSLSRCILEFDKIDSGEVELDNMSGRKRTQSDTFISEVEAVSHARSVLTGILRSNNRGDAGAAVKNLVENDKIANVKMESSEALHIDISFAGDDFSEYESQPHDLAGWVETRFKVTKGWKKRYFVVSEGVLSFFERAEPRPHGLRGQIVLSDALVTTTDEPNVLQLDCFDDERQLRFDDRGEFIKWKHVLGRPADSLSISESKSNSSAPTQQPTQHDSERSSQKKNKLTMVPSAKLRSAAMKAMKGAKNRSMKKIKNVIRSRTGREKEGVLVRRPTTDMLMASTRHLNLEKSKSEKSEPTVQVVVELSSLFKVVSALPEDKQRVLLVAKVKLFQAFLISGGPNGRLARGDEVLEMEFVEGSVGEGGDHDFLEPPTKL